MKKEIVIPGFEKRKITVISAFPFYIPQLLIDGRRVKRNRYKNCKITDNNGREKALKMVYNFFDPFPKIYCNELEIAYIKPFTVIERIILWSPLIFTVQNLFWGLIFGIAGRYFNGFIMRTELDRWVRYIISLLICILLILSIVFIRFVPDLLGSRLHQYGEKKCCWKVSNKTGSLYVLGTVPVDSLSIYPLDPKINSAFESSTELVIKPEIDLSNNEVIKRDIIKKARYTKASQLTKNISKETFLSIERYFKANHIVVNSFYHYKPWFLAFIIENIQLQKSGFHRNLDMDRYFINKAQGKKPIIFIEPEVEYVSSYNDLDSEKQELLLKHAISGSYRNTVTLKLIIHLWLNGNSREIASIITDSYQEPYNTIYTQLIEHRSRKYSENLEKWLTENRQCFVALDIVYVLGDKGILQLLKQKGFSVEQL